MTLEIIEPETGDRIQHNDTGERFTIMKVARSESTNRLTATLEPDEEGVDAQLVETRIIKAEYHYLDEYDDVTPAESGEGEDEGEDDLEDDDD